MTTPASPDITAAVIGVGAADAPNVKGGGHRIGYTHAESYQRDPRVRIAAAADINARNLEAFQKQFGAEHGHADYREMLAEHKPDVLSICTYVGLHHRMIRDAAEAGVKMIVCEKPFVATPDELIDIDRVVKQTGVKLVIAHIRRYQPAFARARELYLGGAVGDRVLCAAGIDGWDLSEWGSHWLDMFRYFHGDARVAWVIGQGRVRDATGYGHHMEDHAVAHFAFEGGGRGLLDGGHALNHPWSMTLQGSEGTIRIRGEHELVIDDADGRRVETFEDAPIWDTVVRELLDWHEGGPEPRVGYSHTRGSAELNLAAYASMLRGDRVDLPLGPDASITEWPVNHLAARRATTS